ncbi:HAD family hydrolase [Streptomyces sp. NPDC001848]|uniref:HAD family hydrolase n=1 Tax=Streptomyces sp. NPDC001848 TaxID=3364618 RepID=UPI0036B837B4
MTRGTPILGSEAAAADSAPLHRSIAFFDVDETLIATKSMLDFWSFWRASGTWTPSAGHAHAVPGAGVDRATLNRDYYRRFAGVPIHALRSAARRWYENYRQGPYAFVSAGVEALRRHRLLGHDVVLVSGSLRPLVEAVAEDLGADEVWCTEQAVTDEGLLTGEVDRPMIGQAKADAVTAVLSARGVPGAACFAYGDHESDLAMLRRVGHPVVVGDSRALVGEAERCGWTVISGRPGPGDNGADRPFPPGRTPDVRPDSLPR